MRAIKMKLFQKKYPCVMQHDESDCAAAALASICKFYKKELTIMKLREIIGTDAYGTSVKGIVTGAENLGFVVKAIKIMIEDVDGEYTLPAIAHVISEEGLSHFVVINKIEKNGIIISDPAKGITKQSIQDFQKIFSGVLVLMIPKNEFELVDYKGTSMFQFFKALMFPQKKLLVTVISVSFILTILGLVSSLFAKAIFDEIIPYQLKNTLYIYMIIFSLISMIQLFLNTFRKYVLLFLSRKIDIPVLLGYYNHVMRLPYQFFSTRKVGDILTRFQDALMIKDIFSQISVSLVLDSVLAVITGIAMWFLNSQLFMIILITVVINIALIYLFKKKYKLLNYDQMESNGWLNSQLIESIENIETVKAYTDETQQIDKLENRFVKTLKLSYEEGLLSTLQGALSSGAGSISTILLMGFGALIIIDGKLSLGDLIVFQTLSGYFIEPIQNLVSLQLTFQEAQVAMQRLSELMDLETEDSSEQELLEKVDLNGTITLKNISFSYGSRPPIFDNLSITLPKGKKVAIVGESGAGKSTLAKLLMKFYKANTGEISFNDYDIEDINTRYLRQTIGYVPQNVELFSGLVIDNIKIGAPDATYEQVISACKRAKCHEFIQKIPGRYYGMIEEGGGNLSGGERQRIAIARAFLHDRQMYIFDESTSNLDSFSEQHIQRMMTSATKGITTIIIAHRLSTIISSDLILFMKEGKVIEKGTHEALLERNGQYKKMIDLQYGITGTYKREGGQEVVNEEISYV